MPPSANRLAAPLASSWRVAPPQAPYFEPAVGWVFSRHSDVSAVLADPRFMVPPSPSAQNGVAWLRGSVSRFSNGSAHARRRAIAERAIAAFGPLDLAAAARERATLILDAMAGGTVDVMSALARQVPLAALVSAFGVDPDDEAEVVAAVIAVAAAYPPGASKEQEHAADAAVECLVGHFSGQNETVANRIAVLVQACDATAGLIGNTLNAALRLQRAAIAGVRVEALVDETLRYDPPVWNTRRESDEALLVGGAALEERAPVVLHLAAANRDPEVFSEPHLFIPTRAPSSHLTFGHGHRACPGSRDGHALTTGVVDAVLTRCELARGEVAYMPSPNLRVPNRLEVTVR